MPPVALQLPRAAEIMSDMKSSAVRRLSPNSRQNSTSSMKKPFDVVIVALISRGQPNRAGVNLMGICPVANQQLRIYRSAPDAGPVTTSKGLISQSAESMPRNGETAPTAAYKPLVLLEQDLLFHTVYREVCRGRGGIRGESPSEAGSLRYPPDRTKLMRVRVSPFFS